MKPISLFAMIVVCFVGWRAFADENFRPPKFKAETIDDKVAIGYGIAIGDVDGDGKPDILLADKKQIVWYQNPTWKKHLIAENLTERDNVCIAARDIDGDGKVEIAVGAQWNPGDTNKSGAVFYLVPPKDRTKKWTPIKLHNEPVVHRTRWLRLKSNDYRLIVSPLHGRGNRGGKGVGVRLMAYEVPKDPKETWRTTVVEDTLHITHNFDPCQWDPATEAEEILYIGQEGAMVISHRDGSWSKEKLTQISHGGEIRMGLHSKRTPFVVTIEPWHGTKLVSYRRKIGTKTASLSSPVVLDDTLSQGHAIATADLLGIGSEQVVAGWRSPNANQEVGLKLYWPVNDDATKWDSVFVDRNGMATEDLRLGDLNGDGKIDIVAAGRSTHNLKVYWNQGPR